MNEKDRKILQEYKNQIDQIARDIERKSAALKQKADNIKGTGFTENPMETRLRFESDMLEKVKHDLWGSSGKLEVLRQNSEYENKQ